jgi:uncharacterized membrane protein YeiH
MLRAVLVRESAMIQGLVAEQVLQTLAGFREYATSTLLVLELVGTFVFALSGAAAGVKHRLDLFGVLVLSFATATAGGIARDLLIGAVPPAALQDWRYLGISVLAGLVGFFSSPDPARQLRLRNLVLTFDAAGLALFAVSGTQKALGYGLDPPMAALLGMLTGIGGGMMRDVLVSEIPVVLRSDLYAVAALAGAIVVVVGHAVSAPAAVSAGAGAASCFGIRLVALRRGWRLPIAGQPAIPSGADDDAAGRSPDDRETKR